MMSIRSRALAAGLRPPTVYSRIRRGWSLEIALTTPTHAPAVSGALGASRSSWSSFGLLTNPERSIKP